MNARHRLRRHSRHVTSFATLLLVGVGFACSSDDDASPEGGAGSPPGGSLSGGLGGASNGGGRATTTGGGGSTDGGTSSGGALTGDGGAGDGDTSNGGTAAGGGGTGGASTAGAAGNVTAGGAGMAGMGIGGGGATPLNPAYAWTLSTLDVGPFDVRADHNESSTGELACAFDDEGLRLRATASASGSCRAETDVLELRLLGVTAAAPFDVQLPASHPGLVRGTVSDGASPSCATAIEETWDFCSISSEYTDDTGLQVISVQCGSMFSTATLFARAEFDPRRCTGLLTDFTGCTGSAGCGTAPELTCGDLTGCSATPNCRAPECGISATENRCNAVAGCQWVVSPSGCERSSAFNCDSATSVEDCRANACEVLAPCTGTFDCAELGEVACVAAPGCSPTF